MNNSTEFTTEFRRLNQSLEKRWNLEEGSLDEYLIFIPERSRKGHRWVRDYIMRVEAVLKDSDQYELVRVENRLVTLLDSIKDEEDYMYQYVTERYNKIVESHIYNEYMILIDDKLMEYHKYARMRSDIDLLKIDQYMKKKPEFDWNLKLNTESSKGQDFDQYHPGIVLIISKFKTLIQLLEAVTP